MASWIVISPAAQQVLDTAESWAARERTLPTFPSFPSRNANGGTLVAHAYSTSDKFSGYGPSKQAHVQDVRDWLRDSVGDSETPHPICTSR